jgi:hypothetical protein
VTLLFVVLTVAVVAAIALVSVGGVTARLAAAPPRSLFDLDEAVEFVAERLSFESSAQLSYDDVRALLGWHLDYLQARGVAAEDADAEAVVGRAAVAADDEGLAFVLGRAMEAGLDVDDVAVVDVLEADEAYLAAIGAVGDAVEAVDPGDPAGAD